MPATRLVYVCDRVNNRVQVFRKDGSFVREFFIERRTLANGSVWDLDLFPDENETFLLNADGANNEVRIVERATGTVVGAFGRSAAMPATSLGSQPCSRFAATSSRRKSTTESVPSVSC